MRAAPTLSGEARHLHGCFFSRPLDSSVIARYQAAHGQIFPGEAASVLLTRIVEKKLDAEAIEYALRWRRKGRELSQKIQILFYLVEVRSSYLPEFVNVQPRKSQALLQIIWAAITSMWKFIKGEYLVRRYGLL
jgi:hypothetical protein